MTDHFHCRVCGYAWDHPVWAPGNEDATFEICPCCFAEAGNDDWTPAAAARYREAWLARGAPWSIPHVGHDGLTTEERLTHVPEAFK